MERVMSELIKVYGIYYTILSPDDNFNSGSIGFTNIMGTWLDEQYWAYDYNLDF